MSLEEWISCPDGCDAGVHAVTLQESRIGLQCVNCGRKIEVPVPSVEDEYRTVEA